MRPKRIIFTLVDVGEKDFWLRVWEIERQMRKHFVEEKGAVR